MARFHNREQAGDELADELVSLSPERPLILGLPRGGVPVAKKVAERLSAPLEVLISRKLGAPMQPELGFGAIAEGGALWLERGTIMLLGLQEETIEAIARREAKEVERRVATYRLGAPLPDLRDKTVILVDDGVATGGTLRAAIRAARHFEAKEVIAAVPVASADTARELRGEVDRWVALEEPESLWAIGFWYDDFSQLSDEDVLRLLGRSASAFLPT